MRRLSPSMESKSKPKRMLVTVRGDCSWQIKKEKKRCTGKTSSCSGARPRRKRVKGLELLPGMVNMVVTADELMAYEAFHIKDALKKHEWRW